MSQMKKQNAKVYEQREIATDIYDCWIVTDLAKEAKPGQFISVYPQDKSTLLPRPISICEIDKENNRLRIVYRIAGKGTTEFSKYCKGSSISILGVLGNGFPLEEAKGKKVFLIGGGIGIPPMLEVAKALEVDKELEAKKILVGKKVLEVKKVHEESKELELEKVLELKKSQKGQIEIILGYRDNQLFLKEEFEEYGTVVIATEDGSEGVKGNVLNAIAEKGIKADVIFACGPMPMLRAIKAYAAENGIKAYLSLEERMACGVGACLGCVCKTKEKDHHSQVKNARVCKEGPVFEAQEVTI